MHRNRSDNRLIYSPSDLIRFIESPFVSWLDRLNIECPGRYSSYEPAPELELLRDAGDNHELQFLESLKSSGRQVTSISRGSTALSDTRSALKASHEIIYQACLSKLPFAGYADFLVKTSSTDGGYEVWDTKLSRSAKPYALLQLCCYADLLEQEIGQRPDHLQLILGTNEVRRFRTDDYYFYYLEIRDAFLRMMAGFDPDMNPPEPDPTADHGRWNSAAEALLTAQDHLVQVAGITSGQIRRLQDAGIRTLQDLADKTERCVTRMADDVLLKLRIQARLQVDTRDRQRASGSDRPVTPSFSIRAPDPTNPRSGLAQLPPASEGDVYFDLEGYPLVQGGLEYLWGAATAEHEFYDWWAHNSTEERTAFESFIDWVVARWKMHPNLHVYHYAPYETATLKRLMGRYGSREDEVDQLLRGNVFVDLYRIVQQGVVVGGKNYSLKTVEQLYRGVRSSDVANAGASIVAYGAWQKSGESPDWRRSPLLKQIRDYNEDDCVSTWQLARWLREQQKAANTPYVPPSQFAKAEDAAADSLAIQARSAVSRRADLAKSLLKEIPDVPSLRQANADHWEVQELLAHFLEFHRREDKPKWWARFDWHASTDNELVADGSCLGGLVRTKRKPQKVKQSFVFEYGFDPSQETKLSVGDRAIVAHDLDLSVTIHSIDPSGLIRLSVGAGRLKKLPRQVLPPRLSLIPNELVAANEIQDSIERLASRWQSSGRIPKAFRQFLLRKPPAILGQAPGPLLQAGETATNGAVRNANALDEATLCLQGPPGTGKTFTAAHMIAALLQRGLQVGVTSNSHKAILNLMAACQERQVSGFNGIKVGGDAADPLLAKCPSITHVSSSMEAAATYESGLIGGTAWLFARQEMEGRLDYLFVDEAGQVSLANLAAMCASTKNIIVMGDQMQLGQPTQGTHPGNSGCSLLDYYLSGHAVIPDDLGVFLGQSWRMHPGVCHFISGSVYEGRLGSHASTARRVLLPTKQPPRHITKDSGILFCPVSHGGNSQSSEEEADLIVELTAELQSREHCDRDGAVCGPLTLSDILYVAPYNKQVRLLREKLPQGARVASVDKFQGQEAPVVIVSMCSSASDFGPRGLEFVLNQNRLNVAISRAQTLAVVVGDPGIGRAVPSGIPDMVRLNLYCRVMAEGRCRPTDVS